MPNRFQAFTPSLLSVPQPHIQSVMATQTNTPKSAPHPTPDRLMQMAWGFSSTAVLESALELSVFTHIARGTTSPKDLAAATKASRRGLDMLLDALVGFGLLAREGQGESSGFRLAPDVEAFLVEGQPAYIGDFIRFHAHMPREGWSHLTDCVRSGRPVVSVDQPAQGVELWHKLVDSLFAVGRAASLELGKEIARAHPSGPIAVLDVAAGSGVWGIGAAESDPRVRVTAMDLEETLQHTRRFVRQMKLEPRFEFQAGDLRQFDFGAAKYDAAILGHICHSEGPAETQALFAKMARALKPGGTLAIAEFVPDAQRNGPPLPLVFALNMLVNTSAGGTYTAPEYESWLVKAGFRDFRQLRAPAPSPLMLATR
jgi:ubiquinone/menaquinone biosynthesis C-methylase UbiE